MKIKLNQSGIAHIGLILISLLVIGVVGFAAYRINSSKTEEPETQQAVKTEASKEEVKKKTYEFELTELKMDIPESWQTVIDSRTDQSGDGKDDSYSGKIMADSGWGIEFTSVKRGIGGGPGCDEFGESNEEPDCPTYTVISKDAIQTGDVLVAYSSNNAGKYEGQDNCTLVKDAKSQYNDHQRNVGEKFKSTLWNCTSFLPVNEEALKKDPEINKPGAISISVIFPYDLDKKVSTEYTKDDNYKAVLEALKTLRKS